MADAVKSASVPLPPVRVRVPAAVADGLLARSPLFRGADRNLLGQLAATVEGVECAAGATLVVAGSAPEGIGIIVSGGARVELARGSELLVLDVLQPPALFGESGLLAGAPQPYSVVATEDTRALWLRADVVARLAAVLPAFSEQLARRTAQLLARVCALPPPAPPPALLVLAEPPPAPKVEDNRRGDDLGVFDPAPLSSLAQGRGTVRTQVPFIEIADYDLSPSVVNMVPAKLIRLHRLLPVKLAEQRLTVAMVAPRNQLALTELQRVLPSAEIVVVACGADDFNHALGRLRLDDAPRPTKGQKGPSLNPDSLVFESAAQESPGEALRGGSGDDALKLVNRIIIAGIEREASDVHIEPTATGMRVRFRVDGMLADWAEPIPPAIAKSVVARVKVLAGLDITERRLPQDGRIGMTIGKREVDLRVSTLPANRGEKVVFRILEAAGSTRPLDHIFLEPTTLAAVRRALHRPFGGILVCGATGSGKTSSMYALLSERKTLRPDTNIITVEDPIEYRLGGITQVQVNPAAGLLFPVVLRGMLRQDPDVIVVGETRDHETAQMALEAAMTGHLLLTSLHANNAMTAFQRLENLGCSRALIAQSIAMVLVQRLVRKLCQACVTLDTPPKALLESLVARNIVAPDVKIGLPRAVGCDACKGTGYVGRAVVVEALAVTDEIRNALGAGKSLGDIERIALASHVLMPFHASSAYLMGQKLVSASEALLTVAE